MASDPVLVEVADRVARVTLNRPERLNAINTEMVTGLLDALAALAGDRAVRCVTLTGAGRAFCAGGDVASLAASEGTSSVPARPMRELMEVSELLHGMPKPTIAVVNGPCAGAGLSWAAACDLRIAAMSAVFATAFVKVGVSGDHGGVWSVTQVVGPARARQLFLLGERISAVDALSYGLVQSVIADDDLRSHADALAAHLASVSPSAMRAMKANLNDAIDLPLNAYLDIETERFIGVLGSDDAKEAARAFLEKRPAVFGDGSST